MFITLFTTNLNTPQHPLTVSWFCCSGVYSMDGMERLSSALQQLDSSVASLPPPPPPLEGVRFSRRSRSCSSMFGVEMR